MDILLSAAAIGFLSLIILICFIQFRPSKVGQGRKPPMAAGAWPILGHLPLLSRSRSLHKTLGAMADKYGPIFTIKLGATRALVLSNREMAKECFTTNDMVVSSRPKIVAIEHMTYNQAMLSFAPYGPYWRELRKISNVEFFSRRRIQQLSHVRVSEVQTSIKELFDVWSSRKSDSEYVLVDLKQWLSQLVFNMVLRMVAGKRYFGANTDENEAQKCVKALNDFMHLMGVLTVGDAVPFLRWLDFGGHEKSMKETAKELDKIVGEWLEKHRQKWAAGGSDGTEDFIDIMLSVLEGTEIDGFEANTIQKATTWILVLGGIDPSTVTLTWAMCLLLRNPLTLEKAKEELDTQIGKERCISELDINKLEYLQAIVKETLRLYPPGPLLVPHEFTEDCTLAGYHISKGTRLITNVWKLQTDPSIWPEPLEFKPERFLTTHKEVDVRGQHFELLPFGSGRRICPGISSGLHMVHLTLASFLHSFEVFNPSNEPIDMAETLGLINNKVNPLKVLVKPRLSPNCYKTM